MEILVDKWSGKNPRGFVNTLETVLKDVPFKTIHLDVKHDRGTVSGAIMLDSMGKCDELFIFLNSFVNSYNRFFFSRHTLPEILFEIPLRLPQGRQNTVTGAEENGETTSVEIVSPEGAVVGTYISPNIFISGFDISHYGDEGSLRVFESMMSLLKEKMPNSAEELSNQRKEAERKKMHTFLKSIFDKEKTDKEYEVKYKEDEIIRIRKTLRDTIWTHKNLMEQVELLRLDSEKAIETSISEIENIKNMHNVIDVKLNDSGKIIEVYTDTIYILHDGAKYHIGKFLIQIPLTNNDIKFLNLEQTMRRRSYWGNECMHPHISDAGTACFGNAAETIITLSSDREWSTLAAFLISYLESVNVDDPAGKYIRSWDIVSGDALVPAVNRMECRDCGYVYTEDEGATCSACGGFFCDDCITSNSGGTPFCESCYGDNYFSCEMCGHESNNFEDESAVECEVCGRTMCTDCESEHSNHSRRICSSCYETENEEEEEEDEDEEIEDEIEIDFPEGDIL